MLQIRKSNERGYFDHGWLESYHSFSFAGYYDPKHMGFGPLRVINEDWVAPGTGFGTHGHRDMEILTYMLDGELTHRDSLGSGSTIRPGQIQRMSAGRGIQHSEVNASKTETAHLLQIWIEPAERGIPPSYKDHDLSPGVLNGQLALVATGDPAVAEQRGIAHIHQNAQVYAGKLDGASAQCTLTAGRKGYLHLARGRLVANGVALEKGDALMLQDETLLTLSDTQNAEVLFFDLPN